MDFFFCLLLKKFRTDCPTAHAQIGGGVGWGGCSPGGKRSSRVVAEYEFSPRDFASMWHVWIQGANVG